MPRKLEAYIEEVLSAISEIQTFIANMNYGQYTEDSKTKAAVERKLLTIGEALNQAHNPRNTAAITGPQFLQFAANKNCN